MSKTKKDQAEAPWDIKKLVLSLGGIDDSNGFILLEVFSDDRFNMFEGDNGHDCKWCYEDLELDVARRIRDFLIYAIPEEQI